MSIQYSSHNYTLSVILLHLIPLQTKRGEPRSSRTTLQTRSIGPLLLSLKKNFRIQIFNTYFHISFLIPFSNSLPNFPIVCIVRYAKENPSISLSNFSFFIIMFPLVFNAIVLGLVLVIVKKIVKQS